MLNIIFGDCKDAVYDTAGYFKYDYEDEWITDPISIEMIRDIDKSEVLGNAVIDSPVLGKISPEGLSGGVKTLILIAHERDKIFNASTCGNNCAHWLLKLADQDDITINLRHIMDFGAGEYEIRIVNTDTIVHDRREMLVATEHLLRG